MLRTKNAPREESFWASYGPRIAASWVVSACAVVFLVVLADAPEALGPGVVAMLTTGVLAAAAGLALPIFWARRHHRFLRAGRG